MRIIFSILCLILSVGASYSFGKEIIVDKHWEAPTQNVDGSPLAAAEIKLYRVYSSINGPIDFNGEYAESVALETTINFDLLPRADPHVIATAVVVETVFGMLSAPSNEVVDTFTLADAPTPNTVTNPTTTIHCSQCIINIQ